MAFASLPFNFLAHIEVFSDDAGLRLLCLTCKRFMAHLQNRVYRNLNLK